MSTLVHTTLICVIASSGLGCTRCNPSFIGLHLTVERGALSQPEADSIQRLYFSASGPQKIDRYVTPKTPSFKFPVSVGVPSGCIAGGDYKITVTGYQGDTPIALGQTTMSISKQTGPDATAVLSSSVPTN